MEFTNEELQLTWRQGYFSRPKLYSTRGTFTQAAIKRDFDLEPYRSLLDDTNEERRQCGLRIIAEFGDASNLPELHRLMAQDASPRVQNSALHAISTIGGSDAATILMRTLEDKALDAELRFSALIGVLDLVTESWEMYCMGVWRVDLPVVLRKAFEALLEDPVVNQAIKTALMAFD